MPSMILKSLNIIFYYKFIKITCRSSYSKHC